MKDGARSHLERMKEELKLSGRRPTTVTAYCGAAKRFLSYTLKPVDQLAHGDVRKYMLYLCDEGYAASTINQHHFAIRFFFRKVLKKKAWRMEQPLQKRPKRVPVVLARSEVEKLFEAATDVRYQTIWMVLYASGLRLSEAARLRVPDIDSKRMRILVCNGKGQKDRYTVLPPSLLEQLRTYYKVYRPDRNGWLFYGRDRQHPPTLRTLQKIFKEDKTRAGIRKHATPHSLRHYAESRIMPSKGQSRHEFSEILVSRHLGTRHNPGCLRHRWRAEIWPWNPPLPKNTSWVTSLFDSCLLGRSTSCAGQEARQGAIQAVGTGR